jgi:hypothetical protein
MADPQPLVLVDEHVSTALSRPTYHGASLTIDHGDGFCSRSILTSGASYRIALLPGTIHCEGTLDRRLFDWPTTSMAQPAIPTGHRDVEDHTWPYTASQVDVKLYSRSSTFDPEDRSEVASWIVTLDDGAFHTNHAVFDVNSQGNVSLWREDDFVKSMGIDSHGETVPPRSNGRRPGTRCARVR